MANKNDLYRAVLRDEAGPTRAGNRDVAPTQNGALKRAEASATRFPGSAAIAVVADDETGEVADISILGKFELVPNDFADSLVA